MEETNLYAYQGAGDEHADLVSREVVGTMVVRSAEELAEELSDWTGLLVSATQKECFQASPSPLFWCFGDAVLKRLIVFCEQSVFVMSL